MGTPVTFVWDSHPKAPSGKAQNNFYPFSIYLSEEDTPLQPDNLPAKSYIGIFGCMDTMKEVGLEMIEKTLFFRGGGFEE